MIENTNASKNPSNVDFVDIKKYIGVASINVLAINPNNAKLRQYGWNVPDDAEEPKYVTTIERDGKQVKNTRLRFLVQIQDLEDKPVISIDYWCRPEMMINKDGTKCKIIDQYGRTAWGTKAELSAHKIPLTKSGNPAKISYPYKPCHPGEDEIVNFLIKYLGVTPLEIFDRAKNAFVPSKNPGRLTIDNWNAVCDAEIGEIAEYIALQPQNRVKVILGIRTTEDNKTYQTFLNTTYIGNGASPDRNTGEYTAARKAIDKFFEGRLDSPYSFSAAPVKEWKETATDVTDNSSNLYDTTNTVVVEDDEDLPF